MHLLKIKAVCFCILLSAAAFCQTEKRKITAKRIHTPVKIDGVLNEIAWKNTVAADKFIELRPTPFRAESPDNPSEVYFLYDNEGVYFGGYFHEKNKDSIASELVGRDGFGNNDFAGFILDTYNDKLNGFEYFVTPLGEQFDSKVAPPNSNGEIEDFSWNAVWQSASKIQADGWTFEVFIPYSAIRFGKKKVQDWGLNIMRRRKKSGQDLFWQSIDPNLNGFLTQEGMLLGLEDIKPPLRLQFSPYFSAYVNRDGLPEDGGKTVTTPVSGGMDVKYGLNQAFTLDMTLIPDFGQAQSDNRVLNLGPFEQKFNENRPFFTEGTELFNKGNLFYSRRIGSIGEKPRHYYDVNGDLHADEVVEKNPKQVKLINATKISGRTQSGFGLGILNAITNSQHALIENTTTKQKRKYETEPLTNYNVLVLDQTFKHNSSISFVNTSVVRSGKDYDADVSSLLFDFNDKKNKWNIGGVVGMSALLYGDKRDQVGYTHSIYFGKTSGRFNFNIWQDLINAKYDKSDLGYFTNNNTMDQGAWFGYRWTKPGRWFNQARMNINGYYSRLVSPLDALKGRDRMYQGGGLNYNFNAQTKKLWWIGVNANARFNYNDFYEARTQGRVFSNKGNAGINIWWESNSAKKLSWGGNLFTGTGGVFNRFGFDPSLFGKIRFSSKFSVDVAVGSENAVNSVGYAFKQGDDVVFSRRKISTFSNMLNVKYNFTNKMGLNLTTRHNWTRVTPVQFYLLNGDGSLSTTNLSKNVDQNYNYLAVDMVYTWQFAQGSFLSVVWKKIAEDFRFGNDASSVIGKNYMENLGYSTDSRNLNSTDLNSLSVRVIYFLDYLTLKGKVKKRPSDS